VDSTGYAIVTGGGSGIGRAFCDTLAQRGWTVAVTDRDLEAASAVAESITGAGGTATAHQLDVTSPVAWQENREQLQSQWPRLDLLVNNAGNLISGVFDECELDDLRSIVEVNLLGAMYGCQAMTPWLRQTNGNTSNSRASCRGVINLSSIFAAVSPPGFAAYNATKAGVLAMTETLRGELTPYGLSATAVLPGATPTQLFNRAKYSTPSHAAICQKFLESSQITPEAVAQQAIRGAERGKLYVVVGTRSKLYWRLKRLAPQWLIDKVARRAVEEFGVLSDD